VVQRERLTSFQTRTVAENALLISVLGDLDIQCSDAFRSEIESAAAGLENVIISLEQCNYCDSSALSVLFRARKDLGPRLLVVLPTESDLHRLFTIAGLSRDLPTAVTLDRALATFAGLR
jgi:anti-anti-sigma factor